MLTKLGKGILLLKLKVADTVNFTTDINFCSLNFVCNDFEPQASSGFIFILNSSKNVYDFEILSWMLAEICEGRFDVWLRLQKTSPCQFPHSSNHLTFLLPKI